MRLLLTCFITIIISSTVFSQTAAANLKSQAEIMLKAFTDGDYALLIDYTYPKVVDYAGGKDIMEIYVKATMDGMTEDGIIVDSALVGEPGNIIQAGAELHAIISQKIYMHFTGGTMISESSLLAVSPDSGVRWYFLDVKQLTPELKELFFPDFNDTLIVPEPKPLITNYDN